MENGVSGSSLGKKLVGLAFLFKWQGLQDFPKDFWVRQAVKGYRRDSQSRGSRRPVSFEILSKILGQLQVVWFITL